MPIDKHKPANASKPSSQSKAPELPELDDDALKSVTGGMTATGGKGAAKDPVCISSISGG